MATSKSTSPRLTLKVTKAPNEALALTNNVFVNASDFDSLHVAPPPNNYVKIKQYIFNIQYACILSAVTNSFQINMPLLLEVFRQ